MGLDKKHKAFRFAKIMPIDANNVILEQAFARFLVLIRTKGLPITSTTKDTLHPENLIDIIERDIVNFQGIKTDTQRKRLIEHWITSDFTTCVKEGRGHTGKARIANLKPIHMSTIKLLDPRIRSQDRDVSAFFYNVFRDNDLVIGEQSILLPYLTSGTVSFGEHDAILDAGETRHLDIETLFLLRLLEHFKVDKPDKKKKVPVHEFICNAQKQLIVHDTARLLVYKNTIPRRELIQYLITLLAFHTALYTIKSFSIVNTMAETKKLRCNRCKGFGMAFDDLFECDHHPDIFVDLTNGQDPGCDELAKKSVSKHYASMYQYFRSHYKLKKLDEFSSTFPGYSGSIDELLKFMSHKDLEGYFRVKLGEVTAISEEEEQDLEIKTILSLGLSPLDAYVEILYQKTFKTRVRNHKSLMASLCGLNREDGFLHGGKGKRRKYVLGNQLLEVLVQLAVVASKNNRFYTKPMKITDFTSWLRNRYGILVDLSHESFDNPDIARALETNYNALKDRLRQLGFFTDLSDASNSQVIRPRFEIKGE